MSINHATDEDIRDQLSKLLPLIRWMISGAIGIAGWVAWVQVSVLRHEDDIKEQSRAIRQLEINQSAIHTTLVGIDKKLDQIDRKLDTR